MMQHGNRNIRFQYRNLTGKSDINDDQYQDKKTRDQHRFVQQSAVAALENGEIEDALRFASESLRIVDRCEDLKRSPDAFLTEYFLLARIYLVAGETVEAKYYLHHARNIVHSEPYDDPHANANLYNILAELYSLCGEWDCASHFYVVYLTQIQRFFGKNHLVTSDSLNIVASFWSNRGNYPLAIQYCKESLAIRQDRLGIHHHVTADSHYNLGLLLRLNKQYMLARLEFNTALAIRIERYGIESLEVAEVDCTLGFNEKLMGNVQRAAFHCQRALETRTKILGGDSDEALEALRILSTLRNLTSYERPLENSGEDLSRACDNLLFDYESMQSTIEQCNTRGDDLSHDFEWRLLYQLRQHGPKSIDEIVMQYRNRFPRDIRTLEKFVAVHYSRSKSNDASSFQLHKIQNDDANVSSDSRLRPVSTLPGDVIVSQLNPGSFATASQKENMRYTKAPSPGEPLANIVPMAGVHPPDGVRSKMVPLTGRELWQLHDVEVFVTGLFPMLLNEKRRIDEDAKPKVSTVIPVKKSQAGNVKEAPSQDSAKADYGPKSNTKRLYWDVLTNTEGTIWDTPSIQTLSEEFSSIFDDLESQFSNVASAKETSQDAPSPIKKDMVLIADSKRRQNMSIFVKTLLKGGQKLENVTSALERLDFKVFGAGAMESLREFLPHDDEFEAIRAFEEMGGDESSLGPAEQYVAMLRKVPNLTQRIRILGFAAKYKDLASDVKDACEKICKACESVQSSSSFQKFLSVVLKLGNELNRGTDKGQAQGIRLGSLAKLTQTKSLKNESLLTYIVQHLDTTTPKLFDFAQEFDSLVDASRCNLQTIQSDIQNLRSGMKFTENSLDHIQKSGDDELFVMAACELLERAKPDVSLAEASMQDMQEKYGILCSYLGEDAKMTAPEDLFGQLCSFVNSLKSSIRHKRQLERPQTKWKSKHTFAEN